MRQFAVIGLGRFGFKVAEVLAAKGAQVIAVDKDPALVEKIKDIVAEAVQLDSTDEEALRECGVEGVDVAVVSIGEDVESSILTTTILNNMGIKEIVARASTRLQAQILKEVGAARVVYPEEDMGLRVANSIFAPGVLDYIDLGADYNYNTDKIYLSPIREDENKKTSVDFINLGPIDPFSFLKDMAYGANALVTGAVTGELAEVELDKIALTTLDKALGTSF